MKKLITTVSAITLLAGSVVAPLPLTSLPSVTTECYAATNGTKTTITLNGINYTVIYNKSTKEATITKIVKTNGSLPSNYTIPDRFKIGTISYVVSELGDGSNYLFTASNAAALKTLTLPIGLSKINTKAFYYTSIPNLDTLYVNIDDLLECDKDAFYGTKIKYIFNTCSGSPYSVNDVDGFDDCFGVLGNSNAFTGESNPLYLKNYDLNGKLQFLSSVSMTPYSVEVGMAYARKIVDELFDPSVSYTKLQKAEIIFNYLHTHANYSTLYDKNSTSLYYLSAQPMANLALGTGVCGSYAHSFEYLCKAAGFADDEVYCCGMPGHVANAVKINGEYYYVDTTPTADAFMCTCGLLYGNAVLDKQKECYHYTAKLPEATTPITIAGDPDHPTFVKNFSYIYIESDPDVTVSVYDKNRPGKEYIHYSTSPAVENNSVWKSLDQYINNLNSKMFIDTNTYYNMTITVNGVTSQPIENVVLLEGYRTITVDGKTYKVTAYRRPMGPNDSHCDWRVLSSSDDKYFDISIKRIS